MDKGLHLLAVAAYAVVCAIGAFHPTAGAVLIGLFAVGASIRAILSNLTMIGIVLLLVVASIAFPILAPLPLIVGIVLFLKRLAFVFEHFALVLVGVVVYGAAFALQSWGMALYWSLAPLITLAPSSLVWPLGSVAAAGALVMHVALLVCGRMGYRTATALEIMSILPLLLMSLLLPFLKVAFDFVPPLEGGIASGATDAVLAGKSAAVGMAAKAAPVGMAAKAAPVGMAVKHVDLMAAKAAPVGMAAKHVDLMAAKAAPVGMAAKHGPVVGSPGMYTDAQGTLAGRLFQEAGGLRGTDSVGHTHFHVQATPHAEIHTDAAYHTQFHVQDSGGHHTVSDASFQTKFHVQPFGNDILLKQPNGTLVYTAKFIGQDAHIYDASHTLVAKVANAPRTFTCFRGLPGVG